MKAPTWAGVVVGVALVASGCGGSDPEPEAESTPTFSVPTGVTLTRAGSTIDVGETATVVVPLGTARSAVDLTVDDVEKGSIDDLDSFGLASDQRSSTPYYVSVTVENRGPAGLGGSTVPVVLRTEDGQRLGISQVNGDFDPCPRSALPAQFLPGAETELCLVYLLPRGDRIATVDLQPGSPGDAVRVRP